MKITDIRAFVVSVTAAPPSFRWRTGLQGSGDGTPAGQTGYTSLLKVETDAGVVGYSPGRRSDLVDVTRRRLRTLIGMNPLHTESLWRAVWELDRIEEFQMHILGMLDVACWDIKSRQAGMPLYQLLGGFERRVPAYASTVTWDTFDDYERHIRHCMDVGFKAFKLHAWGDVKQDIELSRRLRRWTGPDADLMFDGSAGWDYVDSLRVGLALQDEGFLWYEEPMREFDLPSYARLADKLDIPVLAAETSDGCHWNAATWIQYRALDMMRVSVAFKGGVTGAIKVAHLAEACGMRAQVHGMGYANLHICAAIPNNDYYEQLVWSTEQIEGLKDLGDLAVIDGHITCPDVPGVQPHPDWSEIEAAAVDMT